MRTDGVSLSAEAVDAIRDSISRLYGPDHLPAGGPRAYKSKAKNAQVCVRGVQGSLLTIIARRGQGAQGENPCLAAQPCVRVWLCCACCGHSSAVRHPLLRQHAHTHTQGDGARGNMQGNMVASLV